MKDGPCNKGIGSYISKRSPKDFSGWDSNINKEITRLNNKKKLCKNL